jgi:ABC-2 type transport system ATP-binding protein
MSANIIEVKDLVKKYKKATTNAVNNISFDVSEGEFFAFLGPNGAGKTTTISILTTTLAKTSGTVKIAGYDIDNQQADVRKRIGVIFQNPSLDLNLTAEENIRLHAILYKLYSFRPTFNMMPQSYKDTVMNLSEVLGLKDDIFKQIKTFSGGMKRKLEIVRTLIHKPKILFLDEPTSGLDPLSRRNLWEYLKGIKQKENTTIFLTTHYLEEAEDADNICVINHGEIVINDSIHNIKNRLVKDFIYVEAEKTDELINELTGLGYDHEKSGKGILIYTKGRNTQEIIKAIQTKLTRINIEQPTLEDAYLDLIKEDAND